MLHSLYIDITMAEKTLACQPSLENNDYSLLTGFPKLIIPKAKANKSLFGPIKRTKSLLQMAHKGQSSFGITAILYTYQATKPYSGLLNPPNIIKARAVLESLTEAVQFVY